MYTIKNFKSKKELKLAVAKYMGWLEAIKDPQNQQDLADGVPILVYEEKAKPCGTYRHMAKSMPTPIRIFQYNDIFGNPKAAPDYTGTAALEGPHYPEAHRWYAEATLVNGIVVKVK
jgi:hypothetical protein